MTIITEAGTGLEKGHFPGIMTIIELEAQATVDPGQDPELAQIGREFIAISVGNMIIAQETVPLLGKKRIYNSFNKSSILEISNPQWHPQTCKTISVEEAQKKI